MGIYLSTPKTEKESEDGENSTLRYGVSSMQGWRANMEDAHAAIPDLGSSTSFFGVYDGHGGKAVATFCGKYLHQELVQDPAYQAGDVVTAIRRAFLRMDEIMCEERGRRELAEMQGRGEKIDGMVEQILGSCKNGEIIEEVDEAEMEEGPDSDSQGPAAGSTACVAIIRDRQLVVANAGDSRCIISRNGQAYDLSKDHKPELEAEKERIVNAGGYIQGGRINGSLNLTRAIGDMEFKRNKLLPAEKQIVTAYPDVNVVELSDDDEFLVLACDGVWDCMSSQQVVDYVRAQLKSEDKLSSVCEKVLDWCLAPSAGGEGCDNMTMIIVQLKKPINHSSSTSSS